MSVGISYGGRYDGIEYAEAWVKDGTLHTAYRYDREEDFNVGCAKLRVSWNAKDDYVLFRWPHSCEQYVSANHYIAGSFKRARRSFGDPWYGKDRTASVTVAQG